ncbi:unnamed protein product [Lactuca virosa]|uniref:Uncharacterized protein n=1 Tax=Lactuca virosa TaxID=75947 RepID=A0AAU9PM38_9ASTR|nr:unnamed protein product [Lactuca virosa]
MTLAVMIDENRFNIGTPKTSGGVIRSNNSGSSRSGGVSSSSSSPSVGSKGTTPTSTNSTCLTGHRCPGKTLQVLIIDEQEEDNEVGDGLEHAHLDEIEVVGQLGMTVSGTGAVRVRLGNGGSDIILGNSWLQTLGDMTVNWRELWMKFWDGSRQITITGDPSLTRTLVSYKSMLKLCHNEDTGFLVHMNSTEISSPNPLPPPTIQEVIKKFEMVFRMPVGLPPPPPHRSHEYVITLHEGTAPISVPPTAIPMHKRMRSRS